MLIIVCAVVENVIGNGLETVNSRTFHFSTSVCKSFSPGTVVMDGILSTKHVYSQTQTCIACMILLVRAEMIQCQELCAGLQMKYLSQFTSSLHVYII